jgi:hypothetical protein
MGKSPECLRPHDSEIFDSSPSFELRKDSIEDVSKKMEAKTRYNSLPPLVEAIRDPAKRPGCWHLQEQTNGSESVTCERFEAETGDNGWCICVKSTLWAVVTERDEDVDPKTPVRKLQAASASAIKVIRAISTDSQHV